MLQQDRADDYVIATEEFHTIREFLEKSAYYVGLTLTYEGEGEDEKIYDQSGNLIAKLFSNGGEGSLEIISEKVLLSTNSFLLQ